MKRAMWTIAALCLIAAIIGPIIAWGVADIEKVWASQTILGHTDAYGGADGDITDDTVWAYAPNSVDLGTNGYEATQITLEFDGSNVTDDLIIGVFASNDDSAFDDIPYWQMTVESDGSDDQITFIVRDLKYFRIGMKPSSTTTDFDYRLKSDAWNSEYY
jgi:hypothetical protein